jgi:septum formation protein
LILASASSARARLLTAAGIAARIEPAAIDESEIKNARRRIGEDAGACAVALAEAKASAVSLRNKNTLVIGADQILSCAGKWFDKPRDPAEARTQLEELRGQSHELCSAVTVVLDGAALWQHVARARLTMRRFNDAFLNDYVAAMGQSLTATVGGYALEGLGVQLFDTIEGDYFSILGLPLLPLLKFLRARGAVP